jgi:hypothetical protein
MHRASSPSAPSALCPEKWRAMFAIDNAPNHRLVDVSYVDDCAFPIYSKASTLCGKVASTMGVVQDAFTSFGLTINTRHGKAEIIVMFVGRGAAQAKRDAFLQEQGRITYAHTGGQMDKWRSSNNISTWARSTRQ